MTTAGTVEAERHRVVRAVPDVERRAGSRAPGARTCSQTQAGRSALGDLGVDRGLGREVRPAGRVAPAGEEVEVELVVLGEPPASCTV